MKNEFYDISTPDPVRIDLFVSNLDSRLRKIQESGDALLDAKVVAQGDGFATQINDAIESGNSLESLLEDLRRHESEWREGAGLAALTTWEVSNMAVK